MADRSNADSHRSLSVDTLHHVPKDMLGSDNSVPLSPQWLLPKPGDIKHGMVAAGESQLSPYPGYASRLGISKASKNGEDGHEIEKKRDVFRPSLHDLESPRRDRWRDEERDTNSAIRRDRWKDGEKETVDTRKMDKWVDSTRHSGDPKRAPSDRWNDTNNRDANYDQRRDNKWSTRWGPDDKESESWREKLQESGRDNELLRDKPLSLTNHGKDDKEVDHYRPWRSNSSQSRGRGEPPHHQNLTPNRQVPTYSLGRGRGDNAPSNFTVGRGRIASGGSVLMSNTTSPYSIGAVFEKNEGFHRDHSPLKYSRIKLLDIYRTTDVRSHKNPLDGFFEIPPSLTQAESLEPLALSAPTPEEMVILKGIDKGDIVSSGMPQASKEGSVGRSSTDLVQLGRTKIGSREDLPSSIDDYKEDVADNVNSAHLNYSDSSFGKYSYGSDLKSEAIHNLQTHHDSKFGAEASRSDPASRNRVNEVPISRDVSTQEHPVYPSTPWRSESLAERSHVSSHDWRDLPPHLRSRSSDMGWSHLQKDRDTAMENSSTVSQSYYKDQPNWQAREAVRSDYGRESTIKRQLSDVLEREQEARNFSLQTSPEDLSLYYKDPQGEIQGPFSGSDLIGWFEAGYFGIDLQVRVVNAAPGTPFSSLGDVMPHLRAKARAPPGFGAPKQNEVPETLNRPSFSNHGNLHTNSSGIDILKTDPRSRNESMNEAENRFLESLMSGSLSSSPLEKFASSEGLQGYMGNNPVGVPPMGLESGKELNYLLAQRMSLERQRSLTNPQSNWPGRDAASVHPKGELGPDSPLPHANLLQSMVDTSRQVPLPQNVDLISLLQGVTDKTAVPPINNGVSSWSNFPGQGGLDMRQDKMEMHHNQFFPQAAYGVQQQRLQPQNQQSLTNIIGQSLDNSSGMVTPEKLLSSGLSQDPQMLNLLQQQYLLSQLQLQSQTPVSPQLSLLDKLLLLKQQKQKQEQQQQLLLQQQQLLSQVLSEQHPHLSESYGHLKGATAAALNGPVDQLGLRAAYEAYQSNSQSPRPNFQGGLSSEVPPSVGSQDVGHLSNAGTSPVLLPHQMFENTSKKDEDGIRKEQIEETQRMESLLAPAMAGGALIPEERQNIVHGPSVLQKHGILSESFVVAEEQSLRSNRTNDASEASIAIVPSKGLGIPDSGNKEIHTRGQTDDLPKLPSDVLGELQVQKEQIPSERPVVKENKVSETVEAKKVSEKKSRKQKNVKANSSSDKAKGATQSKQSENEGPSSKDSTINVSMDAGETLYGATPVQPRESKASAHTVQPVASQQIQSMLPGSLLDNIVEADEGKVQEQLKEADFTSIQNQQRMSSHRAWKPATGVKAKSLLEIQQEEERVAQKQMVSSDTATSVNVAASSLPWSGLVANSEPKISRDNHQETKSADSVSIPKSKKSQLHDLLAEEVLAKSDQRITENSDSVSLPSVPVIPKQTATTVDDDDFIQAKDSKKGRKKSGKGKGAGVKVSTPAPSPAADVSVASSPIEKSKSSRQAQQEVLPAPPSGPSLGDFVLWKDESANSSPLPVWSADSGKLPKPTSLRDIQKEQGKKAPVSHQAQIPTPQKAQSTRGGRGSNASWTPSGTSPSKSPSLSQINSLASTQSKSKVEDDLFWGPLDQSKQEAKQSGFPSVANSSSWGSKNTPVKGSVGGSSSRQKLGGKSADYSLSSSPAAGQSSLKGKRDAVTKHTEAMDFRDWCESETVRLTGSKDTSFLEFCLKQSTTEAEILLTENLGSFDPDREFIDKFLNYKELLSADVLEIAFEAGGERKAAGFGGRNGNGDNFGGLDSEMAIGSNEYGAKGGGKKKGKKGKKVSPSVLGFNVVSNRIMMGEIQTVEE